MEISAITTLVNQVFFFFLLFSQSRNARIAFSRFFGRLTAPKSITQRAPNPLLPLMGMCSCPIVTRFGEDGVGLSFPEAITLSQCRPVVLQLIRITPPLGQILSRHKQARIAHSSHVHTHTRRDMYLFPVVCYVFPLSLTRAGQNGGFRLEAPSLIGLSGPESLTLIGEPRKCIEIRVLNLPS
ncbi:unnamed protein product [Protopolystoma xenopodis]|uniref:Uncharacterized protein n=1 Tax=Protopolystoma xenopodis TaxID=117903 RepID=A0A3S5BCC7_9PLAT|nr:unnamed protein product [Protopolystoma xenopodis]